VARSVDRPISTAKERLFILFGRGAASCADLFDVVSRYLNHPQPGWCSRFPDLCEAFKSTASEFRAARQFVGTPPDGNH
jgi:hypothetical protein